LLRDENTIKHKGVVEARSEGKRTARVMGGRELGKKEKAFAKRDLEKEKSLIPKKESGCQRSRLGGISWRSEGRGINLPPGGSLRGGGGETKWSCKESLRVGREK